VGFEAAGSREISRATGGVKRASREITWRQFKAVRRVGVVIGNHVGISNVGI